MQSSTIQDNTDLVAELTTYLNIIETFDRDSAQDASALHAYMIQLTNMLARANYLMAFWQRRFRQEKKQAYQNLQLSMRSQKNAFSPMLAKDYVDAQCDVSGFIYDLAERLSRTCTHALDTLRSISSSLKSEREFARHQQ